ncbi:MAG: ATP-binding cassette domain-containing protein [Oscillospiraceae bacterium]|jgi:cell division transport system ATP-binding protein|nr:ATP-binding cassette domain-containing protein [Oscillospiraceae bacterium]
MVEFKNVDVHFKDGTRIHALKDINLRIDDGEFVFLIGKSGAGKSTLLNLLTRRKLPSSGHVFVNDYNITRMKRSQVPKFRRTIGMVFQDFRLIPSMTVYENVAFVLRIMNKSSREIKKRVLYALELVHLLNKARSYPSQLSGGEQQRCAIARAFAGNPSLIIADEPTGNIDPELSYEIVELFRDINRQGKTVIMVTHSHDMVKYFGGRVICIKNGEVVFDKNVDGSENLSNLDD